MVGGLWNTKGGMDHFPIPPVPGSGHMEEDCGGLWSLYVIMQRPEQQEAVLDLAVIQMLLAFVAGVTISGFILASQWFMRNKASQGGPWCQSPLALMGPIRPS